MTDRQRPSRPHQSATPGEAVPRGEFHDEPSEVHGVPIRELPPEEQVAARTRSISHTVAGTDKSVSELRGELRSYVERDLDEHQELRTEIRGVRNEIGDLRNGVTTTNTHLGEMRVTNEKVQGDLRMLVDRNARADKSQDDQRAESRLSRKNRTAIFVAIAGMVGTLIGFATHMSACQPPAPAASSPAPAAPAAPAPAQPQAQAPTAATGSGK